jgi:hypothetical protein
MALIVAASDVGDARSKVIEAFGVYYAGGCDLVPGVARNAVTRLLFSEEVLSFLEGLRPCRCETFGRLHFNFA